MAGIMKDDASSSTSSTESSAPITQSGSFENTILGQIIKEQKEVEEARSKSPDDTTKPSTGSDTKTEASEKSQVSTETQPKGVASKIPPRVASRSSFRDLSRMGAKSIKHYTKLVNKYASMPFDKKTLSNWIASTNSNWNANQVNEVLSVIQNVLCGDHDSWVFDADAIINALDFKLDFLESWNICGRQKMWNPVDTLLKTISNIEKTLDSLKSWDRRFLGNLQNTVNKFIQNLGLPTDLTKCIVEKANMNFNTNARDGLCPGLFNKIRGFLSADICKRSDSGVSAYAKPLEKAAMTPFVSGLVNYDRTTMYTFFTAILSNPKVDKGLVLEILNGCIDDQPSTNVAKLLELIAYLKNVTILQSTMVGTTIGGINQQLQKVDNIEDIILDQVLNANETGTKINTSDILSIKPTSYDLEGISIADSTLILKSMEDDFSDSKDVTKDFENIIKLIKIADKRFIPEKQIPQIADCKTLAYLADKSSKTSYKSITTSTERIDGIDYLKIEDELSLADKVTVIAALNELENQEASGF